MATPEDACITSFHFEFSINSRPFPVLAFDSCRSTLYISLLDRLLRRIVGPKRDEVTGGWRKLHNEELHNLYSSPSIIRIIKSRRMTWVAHVARMGERNACGKARRIETTVKTNT
jgi:hypothetical protein